LTDPPKHVAYRAKHHCMSHINHEQIEPSKQEHRVGGSVIYFPKYAQGLLTVTTPVVLSELLRIMSNPVGYVS